MNTSVPSGHRPFGVADGAVQNNRSTCAPNRLKSRTSSTASRPNGRDDPSITRKPPAAMVVRDEIVNAAPKNVSSFNVHPDTSTGSAAGLNSSTHPLVGLAAGSISLMRMGGG